MAQRKKRQCAIYSCARSNLHVKLLREAAHFVRQKSEFLPSASLFSQQISYSSCWRWENENVHMYQPGERIKERQIWFSRAAANYKSTKERRASTLWHVCAFHRRVYILTNINKTQIKAQVLLMETAARD